MWTYPQVLFSLIRTSATGRQEFDTGIRTGLSAGIGARRGQEFHRVSATVGDVVLETRRVGGLTA